LKSSDGISIFNLNYGYEVVYIQNGLVRMGFNRINGQVYLAKYDAEAFNYITTHNLQLEKYSDINVKSISDDKIEIQASDTIFTIWRGHPYIMVNHPTEDILFDTKFNRVWAEGVGTVNPSEYPEYWDLQNNSNLLPACVGGTNDLKSSCVDVEEQNIERTDVNLTWASTSSGVNDWNNIIVGQDMNFTLNGTIQNPSDNIDIDGYKSLFGEYNVEFVTDHSVLDSLIISSDKGTIKPNETTDIQVKASDFDGVGIDNTTLYFYERYTPLSLIITPNMDVFEKGDVVDFRVSFKDDDGSGIPDELIYFYEKSAYNELNVLSDDTVLKGTVLDVIATLENEYGAGIQGEPLYFYERYTDDVIDLVSSDEVVKGSVLDMTASLKDEDGSGVPNELLYFYERYEVDELDLVTPTDVEMNSSIDVRAILKDADGSGIGGETVGYDMLVGSDWQRLGNRSTGSDGYATYTYTPQTSGVYSFRLVKGNNYSSTVVVSVEGSSQTVDSITLTADNPIIESGDTSVLTVTALDSNSQGVSGVSLDIYKGSSKVDTVTTGTGGTATYTYTGVGAGDVSFYATDGVIQSEIFVVEDCIVFDSMTSNSGKWTIPSNVSSGSTFGYSSDGMKYGNVSSYSRIALNQSVSLNFKIELDIMDYTNSGNPAPAIIFYDGNGNRKGGVVWGKISNDNGTHVLNNTTNYLISSDNATKTHTHTIEVTSSSITVYDEDTQIGTHSTDNINVSKIELHTGSNRMAQIKNFKVKPL